MPDNLNGFLSLQDIVKQSIPAEMKCRSNYFLSYKSTPLTCCFVEGVTDKRFWGKYNSEQSSLLLTNMSERINAIAKLRGLRPYTNTKYAIIETCKLYSGSTPSNGSSHGNQSQISVVGIIDRDFDDPLDFYTTRNLFVTDTHDLETLILFTDGTLLHNLDIEISDIDIENAFRLSYQLALFRSFMRTRRREQKSWFSTLSAGSRGVDFTHIFDSYPNISIYNLLEYVNQLNTNENSKLKSADLQSIQMDFMNSKTIKGKYIVSHGWNKKRSYLPSQEEDFWEMVNGHDILEFLQCLNKSLREKYVASYQLNRGFEFAIIDAYTASKITKTDLFKELRKQKIV